MGGMSILGVFLGRKLIKINLNRITSVQNESILYHANSRLNSKNNLDL